MLSTSELNLDQPPWLRLSQGQLNLLVTCPRKFQHVYLDQLGSPTTPEQQARLAWGSRFHLLMQQRELGLPITPLIQEDGQLQQCLGALVEAAPEIFRVSSPPLGTRQSEHRRTLDFQNYLFTVIYDLLIVDEQRAQILDWKTYPRPQQRQRLAQDWQTRLYLYVLAETSDYRPEQISMTYWFVQPQNDQGVAKPQSLKFSYSTDLHEQTRQDLTDLLHQLTGWLEHYLLGEAFPQVSETADQCTTCHFSTRCQRDDTQEGSPISSWPADLQDIEEVVL